MTVGTRKIVGTRKEVFHGKADITSGGITIDGLDERGKYKNKVIAANERMKREGRKHLVKVFKPKKKGSFELQPKKGSTKYNKLIKKM
tara:strand:- start:29180 stop:29443 length:264 start_codon:yes stop_codon:yes gene_type:complete